MKEGAGVAWAVLAGGVLAYDAVAKETMSEGMDRLIASHKVLAVGAVTITAAHLARGFEALNCERYDPLHQLSKHTRSFAERYM